MRKSIRRLILGVLAASPLAIAAAASAQQAAPWPVEGKLVGKPKNDAATEFKTSEDVSGLACATASGFPRVCLLVDDESQGAQIVVLDEGRLIAGDYIRLITDADGGKPLELDAEGAAFADGAFYVVGSHGRPRHESGDEAHNDAKAAASRHAFRIRFDLGAVDLKTGRLAGRPDVKDSSALAGIIEAQPDLAPWYDKPLEDNGVTVEGLAADGQALHVGMRGPVLADGSAVILSVPLGAVFDGKAGAATLHRVDLGKDSLGKPRGIRDLAAFDGGFLVLAGPEHDPAMPGGVEPGDYAVFRYDGSTATRLLDLDVYGQKTKPEVLLPLDGADGKLRALIAFDGPKDGAPRPVEVRLR